MAYVVRYRVCSEKGKVAVNESKFQAPQSQARISTQ